MNIEEYGRLTQRKGGDQERHCDIHNELGYQWMAEYFLHSMAGQRTTGSKRICESPLDPSVYHPTLDSSADTELPARWIRKYPQSYSTVETRVRFSVKSHWDFPHIIRDGGKRRSQAYTKLTSIVGRGEGPQNPPRGERYGEHAKGSPEPWRRIE